MEDSGCDHPEFEAHVHTERKAENGKVVAHTTTLRVRCSVCGMQFGFLQGQPLAENNTAIKLQIHPAYGNPPPPRMLDLKEE